MKIILNILFLFFKKIRINKIYKIYKKSKYINSVEIFYNRNFKFESDLIHFGFLLNISFAFIQTFYFLYLSYIFSILYLFYLSYIYTFLYLKYLTNYLNLLKIT